MYFSCEIYQKSITSSFGTDVAGERTLLTMYEYVKVSHIVPDTFNRE